MKGYIIKIGDNEIGPFTSKAAAVAEAKALKEKGFTVVVKERTLPESALFEALGTPEADIDLDADLDLGDDNDDDGDDDDGDGDDVDDIFPDDDDDDKPKPKRKAKKADSDDDDDDDDKTPDDKPDGDHPWFKSFGKAG